MDFAKLSIQRPTFMACVIILSLAVGLASMSRLGVDLFPDVTLPVVTVTTPYPGAGPAEIETLVSKPLEDELSTLSGIKRLTSENREGVSVVVAEFTLETDVKYAEQQVRDHVGIAKVKLPLDIKEPTIKRLDPADQPIIQIALNADLPPAKLFDLADDRLRPMLEQVSSVGLVEVIGGRKREIHVSLDRDKLKAYELSVTGVAARIAGAGENIPSGKKSVGTKETTFRTLGEFKRVEDVRSLTVNFFGNEVPVRLEDLGTIDDTLVDETSRAYVNGSTSLFINAYKQSGSNTVKVADALKKKVEQINKLMETHEGKPKLTVVRDSSEFIRANVEDVQDSILMGVLLAVGVVFLFLANGRSTIITGLALPNSLIGAFILMAIAGYTINIMSLLALSLSVGLLIDDAIVVRENIFRHLEMGKPPIKAALEGTAEVRLAVIATTLTVIAVFGPLGFLSGVVGQFFKQFGLTICFAMAISLFDALTIAPMLSAYFAGTHKRKTKGVYANTIGRVLDGFNSFQDWLESFYERVLKFTVKHPLSVLFGSLVLFVGSVALVKFVPKTFLPAQDAGEFSVSMDMPPGTNIDGMAEKALEVDKIIRKNPEVLVSALTVGANDGDPNAADFYVHLVPSKQRRFNTSQVKERIREQLKPMAYTHPIVKDYDAISSGQRPFMLNILGNDQKELEAIGLKVAERLRANPALLDVDVNFRPGKPEFQVDPDKYKAQLLGISASSIGSELRAQIEGVTPAKFRENGLEYDIRVRLKDDQRDLKAAFKKTWVPNLNNSLVKLDSVARAVDTDGPSKITRQDRTRYITVAADIRPGFGLGDAMNDVTTLLTGEMKLPPGVTYQFLGQGENFKELGSNMAFAMGAGVLFIYLVLASLYESFVTPFTIMLAMPLAIGGSFVALFISHQSLDIFSMIGMVMLMGVAVKNSILLVDYAQKLLQTGHDRASAIILSGKTRLRPILMTTMALIAGTLPIALGLNEASKQRTSMGIAIIGGLVSSTLLTLLVVPAAFSYIDRFRVWSKGWMSRIFIARPNHEEHKSAGRPREAVVVEAEDYSVASKDVI
jgi:hydrophobic/amphiphilic exporter-1 (mainly G- bacteria), HAE1 family